MNVRSTRRSVSAGVCTALLTTAAWLPAQPAQAGSMFLSKSSGRTASATWLEVGTLPGGVPGNIHLGDLWVEELSRDRVNVFGGVTDFTCPEGVTDPGWGGPHSEPVVAHEAPPEESPCTFEGFRFIEATPNTRFTMDRKLTSARLTGELAVFGHDGPAGRPVANMTLTGIGDSFTSTQSGRFSDGTSTFSYRYTFTGRAADVSGTIGAMVFDDHPDEWSDAQMGSYREASRQRTR